MNNKYYIFLIPVSFNLMDISPASIRNSYDLISHLTGKDGNKLDENNYLDYLAYDLRKERSNKFNYFPYENYGSMYIANQISKIDPAARIILADLKRRTINEIFEKEQCKPEMVFITTMSANFSSAVAVALTLNHGEIPVVIGGIHPSIRPEDIDIFIRSYAPHPGLIINVIGAGDSTTIKSILADKARGMLKKTYFGKTTIEDGIWGSSKIEVLPKVPLDRSAKLYHIKRMLNTRTNVNVTTPYLGCPYSCSFCSISSLPIEYRRFQTRSPEDFVNELKQIQKDGVNLSSRYFFFFVDNILLGGEKLIRMLDLIIESNLRINFTSAISIEIAKNESLLKKLRLAGATCFVIGLESLEIKNLELMNKNTVKDIKKRGMTVPEYYSEQIQKIQDFGIVILGAFIHGLPYDYFNSLDDHSGKDIAEFCLKNRIGLQSSCINDLPGSRDFLASQKDSNYLYGKAGTMEYLLSLTVTDQVEPNRRVPEPLKESPLISAYMSYDAAHSLYSNKEWGKSAWYMAKKSWNCPTRGGLTSWSSRCMDTISTYGTQIQTSSFDGYNTSMVTSTKTHRGIFQRLWDQEKNPEVRNMFSDYIKQFRFNGK